MPTTAPGRYQSRLFNFVNRRVRRVSDRSDRALRHFQVATTWGVQVLLYPVYLLFQSARLAGKQLQQAVRGVIDSPSQQLPPADEPIQRVLEVAESFSLPVYEEQRTREHQGQGSREKFFSLPPLITKKRSPNTEAQSPITGIATLPETGELVLVNNQNEILDVLNPEQQQELNQQISFEVASYWYQRHLVEQIQQPSSISLPPPEKPRNDILPVRFFRKLRNWIQNGPIATVVNLFHEEDPLVQLETKKQQLRLRSQELKLRQQELLLRSQKNSPSLPAGKETGNDTAPTLTETASSSSFILSIDHILAELESGNFASLSKATKSVIHRSQYFLNLIKTKFSNSQLAKIDLPAKALEDNQAQNPSIKDVIQTAVDYLFGTPPASQLSGREMLLIEPSEPVEEDHWLTSNDLFGNSADASVNLKKTQQKSSKLQPSLPPNGKKIASPSRFLPPSKPTGRTENKLYKLIQNFLTPNQAIVSRPKSQSNLVVHQKNPSSLNKVDQNSARQITTTSSGVSQPIRASIPGELANTKQNRADIDNASNPATEWIETEAKPTGYVKHPLEKILEWLDLAMLWLEELILKAWNWLQKLIKR